MEKVLLSLLGGTIVGGALAFGVLSVLNEDQSFQQPSSPVAEATPKAAGADSDGDLAKELNNLKRLNDRLERENRNLKSKNSKLDDEIANLNAKIKEPVKIALPKGDAMTPEEAAALAQKRAATIEKANEAYSLLGAAVEGKDGETIAKVLEDLKALGPDAYPTLYKAYNELFKDKDGNPIRDWGELQQKQRELGIPSLRDLVTGDLYLSIIKDPSGQVPPMLINSALWRMSSDPMLDSAGRMESIKNILSNHPNDRQLAQSALWSLGRGNDEDRSILAQVLLNDANTSSEIRATAIEALPAQLDDAMVSRLKLYENSGDKSLEESARYAIQRARPVETGYLVREVTGNSAAASAGLRKGDIIVSINGKPMNNGNAINSIKGEIPEGQKAVIIINRGGQIVQEQIGLNNNRFGIDGGTVYKPGEEPQRNDNNRRGFGGGR